jgi:hypothetical protein
VNIKTFSGLGVLAAVVLAGCASPGPSAPEAPRSSVEPSGRLESQATVFDAYMRKARAIDPGFSGPGQIAEGLQTAASHETVQLEAGMIAYAAMAALQEPSFVAGVRSAARSGDLARSLSEDPARALQLPGASAAAGRASGALLRHGEALTEQGAKVKRAAYTTQRWSWSKARVRDGAARLARVKRLSSLAYSPQAGDAARMRAALAEGGRGGGAPSPIVTRGLALAALSIMGQEERGRALMSEPRTGSCLHLAKLNLYQCMASAGTEYEDIFCLGQHAMAETGQCVVEATKAPSGRRTYASVESWRR